jgi:hypothetical protein
MKKGQSDGKLRRRDKTKKKALDYLIDSVGAGKPPLYSSYAALSELCDVRTQRGKRFIYSL